jgi:hypothetical protein
MTEIAERGLNAFKTLEMALLIANVQIQIRYFQTVRKTAKDTTALVWTSTVLKEKYVLFMKKNLFAFATVIITAKSAILL